MSSRLMGPSTSISIGQEPKQQSKYKTKMKALYAYFGLLDLHDIDSPGHSLYQLGLLDSIRETYGVKKFDFFTYYPPGEVEKARLSPYPDDGLGDMFVAMKASLIDEDRIDLSLMLERIREKHYSRLYLKARFRNLSTLSKKWLDAWLFELIIESAIEAGYSKSEIFILDTDLSLPDSFYQDYDEAVTTLIPSIHFPGISEGFLTACVNLRESMSKQRSIVYYGNINTASYKSGNAKSSDLIPILGRVAAFKGLDLTLICKPQDSVGITHIRHIERRDRPRIWSALSDSAFMLNVTKPKYEKERFIPARIYEALIFGMIPISSGFSFLCPAFSFSNDVELNEILTYLVRDCSDDDLLIAYRHFVDSYKKHARIN